MKETFYRIENCPVNLAIAADLHNHPCGDILSSLERHHPDMILIPGDIIYGKRTGRDCIVKEQKNVIPFLRGCSKIAPSFLSPGNHEKILGKEDYSLIRQTGVVLLDNSYIQEGKLVIGGLTSGRIMKYRNGRNSPDLSWLEEFTSVPGYHILLCHHPEYYPLLSKNIELIVSGHAHGGQWNYYSLKDHRWRGIYAPGQGLFPKYTSGIYDGRLVVSRGLANTTWIPRIFNPTEIVYINHS